MRLKEAQKYISNIFLTDSTILISSKNNFTKKKDEKKETLL